MLESYIAPLFTGYVDKYIKNLKPEDLSLSLWGGDLVLQNLEINLDVLQQELNLPVEFLSGKIHKFQLHVPWTRLNYDPVVITINTMEFIVKLKDPSDSVLAPVEKPIDDEGQEEPIPDIPANAEELPPGYVQGILNKVINNVSFQIHNIIIKYVEDDIVFSLNIKSVDFHSSDEDWNPAFIELKLPDLLLRKVCEITDLTICLDQRSPSGKIELYQDPVLYKCNLTCRILSHYKGLSSVKPYENTLNVYCESFDFSFTDHQVPMVIRLIKLIIGLYYGILDLPGCNVKLHTAPKVLDQHKQEHSRKSSNELDSSTEDASSESWTSWALSMVPGMAALPEENRTGSSKLDMKTTIGVYITLVTVTLKRTNQSSENVIAHQRLEFSPVLCMEVCGCVIECVVIGDLLFDLNLGLQTVIGYTVGNQCVCSMSPPQSQKEVEETDEEPLLEDDVFMKVGAPAKETEAFSFLQRSLFASYVKAANDQNNSPETESVEDTANESVEEVNLADIEDSKLVLEDPVKSRELPPEQIAEKYGGVFFNYYYEMFLPNLLSSEYDNIFLFPDIDEKVNEISEKRINIASCQLYVTTKFVHFMNWFFGLATNNIPERKKKATVVLDSFVLGQLEIGNLLSRKFTITMNDIETHVMAKDHDSGKYIGNRYQEDKEALLFKMQDVELEKVDPMYPVEFVSMVEKGKLVKLHKMENLNVLVTLKVNGAEAGISYLNTMSLESFSRIMIQPTNFEASLTYTLLPDTFETKSPCIRAETTFKCNKTAIMFTKIQALLFYLISMSWLNQAVENEINIFANSVFNAGDSPKDPSPLMNIDVEGITLRIFDMIGLRGMSGVISKVLATLQTAGKNGNIESATILQAPYDTENLHNVQTWSTNTGKTQDTTEPFIQFMLQCQKENCKLVDTAIPLFGLKVAGITINLDHLMYAWLTYLIDGSMRRKVHIERRKMSLNRSMTTSTQRRTKSYARVLGGSSASPSSLSKTIEKPPQTEELDIEKEICEVNEHYAEWIAKKMNFFKAFNLQVDVGSAVIVLPTDSWPTGSDTSTDFVQMIGTVYQDDNVSSPNALVICLPKLTLHSASEGLDVFQYPLPLIFKQNRKNKETFPWSITCKDLTVFTLFSEKEDIAYNEKIETLYICKPVSWNIYLASTSHNHAISKSIASLGIIPETGGSTGISSPGRIIRSNIVQEKLGNALSGKHILGFVLHMDWSICECFVSLKQLLLVSQVLTKINNTWNSMALQKTVIERETSVSLSCSTTTPQKNKANDIDRQSRSTASIIDRAEGMSTITGSSSVFPNTKGSPDCINVSLWIQCTLPKVKCTILSHSDDNTALYQVISEIDEIMFAFDYQDAVLELTNKIASCVVYYSLLRFDTQPDGWTVIDNNYLLSHSEKYHSSHVDAKTLLSIIYRRTQVHSQSISSPDESDSGRKVCDLDPTHSAVICTQEENITKHELNVNILPLDLICFTKPILSSLNIFIQILPTNTDISSALPTETALALPDNFIGVTTLPSLDVHIDSVRIIIPVGEVVQDKSYSCIDNTEPVFLFHFQSFDLHSSPVNPISKTVTDRAMYRQIKQSYRDVLKKLKLWNVQYQLDLSNIGLCTTNWQSLESSLPGKFAGLQNPALEWNSHSGYGQQVMTPIFPGFDFKATIAPPIISRNDGQMYPVTAAAFELHSPKEVKLFINSSQIELAINLMNEVNTLASEVTQILQHSFPTRKDSNEDNRSVIEGGHLEASTPNSFTASDLQIPCIELFSSVSSISISIYLKESKQPLVSTIYPAFYINLMQPTFTFTSLKETKFQLKLHDLDIVSSSNFKGINCESPVPLPGDFDLPLFSCGIGCVDEKIGSTPVLLDVTANFETLDNISLYISFEKPVYAQYNIALDKNIKLFIENVSNRLSKSSIKPLKEQKKEEISSSLVKEGPSLQVTLISITAKRVNASLSVSENVDDVSINLQYQKLNCLAGLMYQVNGNAIDLIDIKSQFDCVEIYFNECGNNSALLMPTNLKLDAVLKFCLHSGNNLHKSLFPKIYLFAQCGLMQLHVNQHLYQLINTLSAKMVELMATDYRVSEEKDANIEENTLLIASEEQKDDGNQVDPESCQLSTAYDGESKEDDNGWPTDLVTSQDDLRNGSFEYIVLKGEEMMTPMDNEIIFTDDHYSYSPVMTWKYPQPRVITDLSVLPVPFHVSGEEAAEPRNLPCLLQYWDVLKVSFVTCQQFYVSENESSNVTIVEATNLESVEYELAEIWRVVVGVSEDLESEACADDDDDDDAGSQGTPELSVVPASSLVACMKVNSLYAAKLVPSLETNVSISKVRIILSNSLCSLGKGSPSDLSPFYIDKENCYPDLIESIELCFEDIHWTGRLVNNLKIIFNFSSQFQFNVMDFHNLCWLRFLCLSPINIWIKQLLTTSEISLDKMSVNLDVGATEIFITQTAVHTVTLTAKAWSNLLKEDPEFLVFNHYVLCNETDEKIHLQQMNTDEDIILQSGQMYPYSWCSKHSKSLRFCLDSVGDWKWSEPINLDQVGVFPRKLEHKKFSSLLFVEIKKISGIQSQVIFHGSCSFLNNLNFDVRLSLVTQEAENNALHANIVNVTKDFIIQAGTTRPSVSISPSFIKSIGVSKFDKDCDEQVNENFVISVPQREDDTHFTIQVQDGTKSLLCWLSFDYTSTIFGQLVVTVSPKFIFRNHFPHPINIKASARDNNESVDISLDGKSHETQVFDLFPEKWINAYFSFHGSISTTAFPLNTTMHQLLKDNDYCTDFELNDSRWPFLLGTKGSLTSQNEQKVCYKEVETEEICVPSLQQEIKCKIKSNFQATIPWLSLPTILVDVKPCLLLTNVTEVELFVKSGEYNDVVKSNETIAPHIQKEIMLGMSLNGNIIWSSSIALESSSTDQPPKQKALLPNEVTHCSIMDLQNNHCYQYSFTCQDVYGMLTVTIHKRFMIHNLSDFHLTMTPLIFTEFKGENVFAHLSAIQLPPKSESYFYLLNTFTVTSNQIPDGMVVNFQLTSIDMQSEDPKDTLLSYYKFKECDSFLLSKEHLRETIFLSDGSSKSCPLVLTSGLDNGVVHVFVDKDESIAVTIHNRSHINLFMKEVNMEQLKKNKHAEVLLADISSLVTLLADNVTFYQPHTFNDNFPKTDNKLELNCQFALYSQDAAELSQPICIEKDKHCKLFIPNHGEIYIKSYINNSKLYVELDTAEDNTIAVSLKHLSLPLFHVKLSSIDVVLVDYSNHDKLVGLISASFSRIELNHIINDLNSTFKLTCGFLQVDNQVKDTLDHFPVLFLPMRQVSERYHSMTEDVPFSELEACLEADVFSLTFEINESTNSDKNNERFVNNIRVNMQPCEMYIEDTMIYRLANVFYTYLPRFNGSESVQPAPFKSKCLSVLHPLRLCNIEVGEISILLSFHASVKIFLAADHIPLVFTRFKLVSTQTVTKEFIRSILYNYATQALVRVGWILGSLNIIGSPTGLIQSIGHGLSDFFVLPYNGLIRGPSAFVSGISLGMSSLMKHVSTGALTSLNNVTSSISRNMDRLSFDDLHLIMQEESRAESPTKVSKGFSKAFETLGMSLLGAVAGIVDHPIQNVTEANNTTEVLSGIASGFAKGIVGMFTKPIGGAMEFVSQASQGILQGAGLVKVPGKVFVLEVGYLEKLILGESQMKYLWQYLHSESYAQMLVVPYAVIKTSGDEKVKSDNYNGTLILTDTALLVYNSETNQVASIFPLKEVELSKLEDETSYKLQIYKHANEQQFGITSLDENPNFRQFFDSFREAAVASHTEVLCETFSTKSPHAVLEVELDQIYGELLITLCKTKKIRLLEETYVLDCVDL